MRNFLSIGLDYLMIQTVDVLIVGGGQAGLATAFHLTQANKSFLIVEKNLRLGDNWRQRYDSLVLFASRRYSHIPGLKMKGDQKGYSGKEEIADYLENYAAHFKFPLALGSKITNVIKQGDKYLATYNDSNGMAQQISSRALVIATGGFQKPNLLKCASNLSDDVLQLTTKNYQRPSQIPSGPVLIVGDGATGRQVAKELNQTHEVILASSNNHSIKPQKIFGKDYFWWLDKLGLLKANKNSILGNYMRSRNHLPGKDLKLRKLKKAGIQIENKVQTIQGDKIYFKGNNRARIKSVIWAIGYHSDYSWLKLKGIVCERGDFLEERGVSKVVKGLYCIGKSWQWTRGSATLTGVGSDAKFIVDNICDYLPPSSMPS